MDRLSKSIGLETVSPDNIIPTCDEKGNSEINAKREAAADFVGKVLFKGKEYRGEIADALKYGNELPDGDYETSLSALEELAQKDKNLFVRIWNAIKRFISALKNHLTNNLVVSDLKKLERKLKKVYESAERKNTADSGVKYYLGNNKSVLNWDIDWDPDNHSSIKSQITNHLEEINNMGPVTSVYYDKQNQKPYYKQLDDILKEKFGYKIDRQSGETILFDPKAISNITKYVNTDAEAAAIIASPYVLKRGKSISGHKNHKGNGYPSVTYAAPVIINGKTGNVGVSVLFGNKQRIHAIRVLGPDGNEFVIYENKAAELTSDVRSSEDKRVVTPIGSADDIIPTSDTISQEKVDNIDTDDVKYLIWDEYKTNAMIWANAADRKSGDCKILNRNGGYFVLIRADGEGNYTELKSGEYREVKAEYDEYISEQTDKLDEVVENLRSGQRQYHRNSRDDGNGRRNAGNIGPLGGETIQNHTAGDDEHLRSGDRAPLRKLNNEQKASSGEDTFSMQKNREITETKAFKKWLCDSKAVNKDGTPKVFYHGTNENFSVFNLAKSGSNFGETAEGMFFFTDRKDAYPNSADDYAQNAARKNGGNARIYEVYLYKTRLYLMRGTPTTQ